MNVEVVEVGVRPAVFTKARRFAPDGARRLGELLGQLGFADVAQVVLDWDDSLGNQPAETRKPVLYLRVAKKLPQYQTKNVLTVESRIDVDDTFGRDTVTADILLDLTWELQVELERQLRLREEWN